MSAKVIYPQAMPHYRVLSARIGLLVGLLIVFSGVWIAPLMAQPNITEICPSGGIQPRPTEFTPGGIILTAFDSAALWVYDIDRNTRYPLPDTRPCSAGCRLAPDARWLLYVDPNTTFYGKMRPDGTERTPLFGDASDVQWWSADTFLVWTPDHLAYLQQEGADPATREFLPVGNVLSVQPGGRWGVILENRDGNFWRVLANMEDATSTPSTLAPDAPFFNAEAWSSNGQWLAYVGRGAFNETTQINGAELFLTAPGSAIPQQLTYFSVIYGAVRIGGYYPASVYWSPDNTKIAFWVTPLTGSDPAANTGNATLHLVDVTTGQVSRYCGFTTSEHTPNPARIVWSPDSSHVAFAGNVAGDEKGHLLLALNITTGIITELSDGIFPAPAIPDVVAWGLKPG